MNEESDDNLSLEPSRPVADRRWSAPGVPQPAQSESTGSDSNWLSGLVRDETPEESYNLNLPLQEQRDESEHTSSVAAAAVDTIPAGPGVEQSKTEPPQDENAETQEVSVATLVTHHRKVKKQKPQSETAPRSLRLRSISAKDKATLYRALSAMFDSGVPLFATFEFLARDGENEEVCRACRRIAQRLVAGHSLAAAARDEPEVFDAKAARMLEAGLRGGQLSQILSRLATDEEASWKITSSLKAQLTYPISIALFTLGAVVFLPPLVLTDLLRQVVSLTSEPPWITRMLLNLSEALGSPWTWAVLVIVAVTGTLWFRSDSGRRLMDNLEPEMWSVPALGDLKRGIAGMRFIRVFNMTYHVGLPVLVGMELAASATGSVLAVRRYPLMKQTLMEGGTLTEAFEAGGFLPQIAIEAISAGESSGQIPTLLESAAAILETELQTRIESVGRLIEPIILAILGLIVGTFVLGCLLPIVELTAKL